MCGIWCSILPSEVKWDGSKCHICDTCCGTPDERRNIQRQFEEMRKLHKNRGPDISSPTPPIGILDKNHHIHLSGHVLWTQGMEPCPQPYTSGLKDIESDPNDMELSFLFNGDIYSFTGSEGYEDATDNFHPDQTNDGLTLFSKILSGRNDDTGFDKGLITTIGDLRGPFAFVLVVKTRSDVNVWFGRDFFGRQSLLFSSCRSGVGQNYHISSVSVFESVFEIPAAGMYKMDLNSRTVTLFPYHVSHKREEMDRNMNEFTTFLEESCNLQLITSADKPCDSINLSFKTKIIQEPHDPEGSIVGLPTTMPIAGMTEEHRTIFLQLLNLSEMKGLTPAEILRDATSILDPFVTKFLDHLRRSVLFRLRATAPYCKVCVVYFKPQPYPEEVCPHSRIGVLFSGGLDSTVLAYLAIEAGWNEIDLLNVAFSKDGKASGCEEAPDRQTGRESCAMLQNIFKGKLINESSEHKITLRLINETKDEVEEMRKLRIKTLISPLKSVIDDSVGCCLWFAARGPPPQCFLTFRTVLMGSGADELLGGYSRHRSAFERGGWSELATEMQFDLDRISSRNMGRDNRVVSDHGLSPRMPYLDEGLVHFLTQEVPIWAKCFPPLGNGERGIGEKILLRAAAYKLFGPEYANIALFPKRAMQFGSRIAKLENSHEKGAQYCDRLL